MRVVGLDLSLTSTGVACDTLNPEPETLSLVSRLKGVERLAMLRDGVLWHVQHPDTAALVVLEGYSFGSQGSAVTGQAELGGVIRLALHEARIPFVVIAPAKVKKYATGKGNAKKEAVLGAAVHRAGREFATTDEADAWWLRQMGCAHLDLPHVQMPAVNRSALEGVEWPNLTGAHA